MATATRSHFTTGELGDFLGIQGWKIARLYELNLVPEPPRAGGRRLIPQASIPDIVDALRSRNWLPVEGEPVE